MRETLDSVILSWPKNLTSAAEVKPAGKSRSWIQLARTGSFVSNRYGKFSITKSDLSSMLHNFANITPKSPTELPIDYDHMSMDPKKPGDGIAAGWMKKLELRAGDEELWAEVEWTPDGAKRVDHGEYRFISPSFVKDHTHKDGTKIGTTLLAAAVTNHPFLEGMKALTLYNFSTIGDLAMGGESAVGGDDDDDGAVVSLSEVGQRVMIAPGLARTHDEVGGTFEIFEVVGDGDDAFVSLKDVNGVVHKWFRSTELLPASATVQGLPPNLSPGGLPPRVDTPGAPGAPGVPGGEAPVGAPDKVATPGKAAPAAGKAGLTGPPAAGDDPALVEAKTAVAENPPAATAEEVIAAEDAKAKADGSFDPALEQKENEFIKQIKAALLGADNTKTGEQPAPAHPVVAAAATKQPTGGVDPLKFKKKGITNMMFKLRNDKNEEVTISLDALKAAGISVVPDGHTPVPTTELVEMKGTITSLSSKVDEMSTANAAAEAKARKMELSSTLDRLSTGGYIDKPKRDFALATWGESTDLTQFKAWAATFTKPIIALNTEFGGGGSSEDSGDSTGKLISLAITMVKDQGITLRDAIIKTSAEHPELSESYLDGHRLQ